MTEPTIEVHLVPAPNKRAQRIYQITTRRHAVDDNRVIENVINITEREACDLINDLVREMVGGDDG